MLDQDVKSLPIRNATDTAWIGMVDCISISEYLSSATSDDAFLEPLLGNVRLWEWDEVTTNANEHLEAVVHHMVFNFCHSLMAVDGDNIIGYITQQSVTALLDQHLDAIYDESDETLQHLGFVTGRILTCQKTDTVRTCMQTLKDKHFQSIAIVDAYGKLVSEFSSSTIRSITSVAEMDVPLEDSDQYRPWVLTCLPKSTIREVIRTLVINDLYRQYIVEAGRPVGVVTLSGILAKISQL
ncbi:hypothetical protein SARC_11849 [Sphaeroforma arctica JP610]|uniref:CBS domain-containing protein n=1 Tax=Sphaeroforma arctica JP610 TaxID=667725 RepID=A0A0L0FFT6_9EUKA|nr:hypothetical protein SARC_11849 [Sphaeroforma arctica JP610]KNC75629.1 hypothetical protein SARC_11849 [Sphaeroforma arctica JP610]|eukprot:XP_014149531.1 hypothetical protein SARC_11849 [Sphaeroforma arctica JP610]